MHKYNVLARVTTYLETEIEAEHEDQAWEIAQGLDGGEFIGKANWGDWEIYSVWEIDDED